jgi:hypothetical protein
VNRRHVRTKILFQDSFLAALIFLPEQNGREIVTFKLHVLPKKLTASMGGMRNVHKVLVGTCEGRRPFGRRRPRWEDNIKMVPAAFYMTFCFMEVYFKVLLLKTVPNDAIGNSIFVPLSQCTAIQRIPMGMLMFQKHVWLLRIFSWATHLFTAQITQTTLLIAQFTNQFPVFH